MYDYKAPVRKQADIKKRQTCAKTIHHQHPVVQRAVGFEFQTVGKKWNVAHIQEETDRLTKTNYFTLEKPNCNEHILSIIVGDTEVKNDGSDLEFVTKPVDERDMGAVDLLSSQVTNVYDRFMQTLEQKNISIKTSNTSFRSIRVMKSNGAFVNIEGDNTAHPQATVGVKKESILELLNRCSNIEAGGRRIHAVNESDRLYESSYGHTTFAHNVAVASDKTNVASSQQEALCASVSSAKNLSDAQYDKEAKGLIAFINMCVDVNEEAGGNLYNAPAKSAYHTNAKNKMPVMPRTTFKQLFDVLNQNAKTAVVSYFLGKPDVMGKYVAYQADGAKVTVRQIIQNFLGYLSTDPLCGKFSGIGSQSRMEHTDGDKRCTNIDYDEQVGGSKTKVEGAIVELRALPNNVPHDKWGEVVQIVAQIMREVNGVPV